MNGDAQSNLSAERHEAESPDLPPRPSRWRLLLPAWVRSFIWADEVTYFDAFLSYSWAGDHEIAPVIQSALQGFLRPWYRVRALNIFRDLSSLAASSNLGGALAERLDRSRHLIVLASPQAKNSAGMEFEAAHWFSRSRAGDVLVIVTSGHYTSWPEIRDAALPPTLRRQLQSAPLWIDLSGHRDRIAARPMDRALRKKLPDLISQLILAFHPGQTWEGLRGEERLLRRRARAMVGTVLVALGLTGWIAYQQYERAQLEARNVKLANSLTAQAREAERTAKSEAMQKGLISELKTRLASEEESKRKQAEKVAEAQQLAGTADSLARSRPTTLGLATKQVIEAVQTHPSLLTESVLRADLSILPPLTADIDIPCRPMVSAIDSHRHFLALGGEGGICVVDVFARRLAGVLKASGPGDNVAALGFSADGSLVAFTWPTFGRNSFVHILHGREWNQDRTAPVNLWVSRFAFSPGGQWMALGTHDGEVLVMPWQESETKMPGRPLVQHGHHADISVLEPITGGRLLVGSKKGLEIWKNWDGERPERVWYRDFEEDSLPFRAEPPVAIDVARNLLAVAHDGTIEVLTLGDLNPIQNLQILDVDGLTFTSLGWLTAHTRTGEFRAWRRPKTVFVQADRVGFDPGTLNGNLTAGDHLATTSDGEYVLAVHTQQGATESWGSLLQITSTQEVARFYHSDRIWQFFSLGPGSTGVTAAEYRVRFWGNILARNGKTSHLQHEVEIAAVDELGTYAAVASTDAYPLRPSRLQIWDLNKSEQKREFEMNGEVKALQFDSTRHNRLEVATEDGLWEWDPLVAETDPVKVLDLPPVPRPCLRQVAFAREAGTLVASAEKGKIWASSAKGLVPLKGPELPDACVEALAVSPEGNSLAASFLTFPRPMVYVLDAATGRTRFKIPTQYLVHSMSFSSRGQRLALATALKPKSTHEVGESGIELWSVQSGTRIVQQNLNMVGGIFHPICLSSDGGLLGTALGAQAQIWQFDSGTHRLELRAAQTLRNPMKFCQFNGDGKKMCAADRFGMTVVPLDANDLADEARRRLSALR